MFYCHTYVCCIFYVIIDKFLFQNHNFPLIHVHVFDHKNYNGLKTSVVWKEGCEEKYLEMNIEANLHNCFPV